MAMIAASLAVVMAAIDIEATTVRIGVVSDQQKREREAYCEPKKQ